LSMMRTSWPLEPAAFLTQAWNSPSAEGVQAARDLRVGQKIADRISRAAPYERWLPRRLCREHAAKSEMTGCAAYGMTLSSRGSVAMAVRRCAQVRSALDNSPILFADVFSARRTACMNRRVARRRVVGQPRSGRQLPDVAGDVVEGPLPQPASPAMSGQSRGAEDSPTGIGRARCSPAVTATHIRSHPRAPFAPSRAYERSLRRLRWLLLISGWGFGA
jgi:hypothetical protein